jgi:2-polyprenyl-3-methyl-5-hydroxy-6-metoxy-1,4-benzoquinol methylase
MTGSHAEHHAHGVTEAELRAQFDAFYAGEEPLWSGEPNGSLVAEVSGVPAGRALDVGCGEGADAVWLAQQGWQVTAIDVAKNALDRAAKKALEVGAEVLWVHAGLLEAGLPSAGFDLVTVHYAALRRTPDDAVVRTLMRLVAPGGTLLVVHHADIDVEEAKAHGCNPADFVSPDDVREALDENWVLQVNERRARHITGGAGAHHTHDIVVKAQRLGANKSAD